MAKREIITVDGVWQPCLNVSETVGAEAKPGHSASPKNAAPVSRTVLNTFESMSAAIRLLPTPKRGKRRRGQALRTPDQFPRSTMNPMIPTIVLQHRKRKKEIRP